MIYAGQRLATMIESPEEATPVDIVWAAKIVAAAVAMLPEGGGEGIASQTPAQYDAVKALVAAIFA